MRRTRQMPEVSRRWMLDGLVRGWIVPTNALQPVITDGTATPAAITLTASTPAASASSPVKIYWRTTPYVDTVPLATGSTAWPGSGSPINNDDTATSPRYMNYLAGASGAGTNRSVTKSASTNHQDHGTSRFIIPIVGQVIGAATWFAAFGHTENSTNANDSLGFSLYVWRPSTTTVVGYIYDTHGGLDAEPGSAAATAGRTATFAGNQVTSADGDVLILETWHHAVQATAATTVCAVYFGGSVEPTENSSVSVSDVAAYITGPVLLVTATPTAIARTVTVPAPTVTGEKNGAAFPTAVVLTAVTAASTTSGSSNTTPSAIALTAATAAPTTSGGSNTTPAAIALTVTTPDPTATGGSSPDGTAFPAAVALVATTSAPTGSGEARAPPATIVLSATTPAPTAGGGSNTSPAAIALTLAGGVTFRSISTNVSTGNQDLSPGSPSGAVAGDLLIAVIACTNGSALTMTAAGGQTWTEITDLATAGQERVWWAVHNGSLGTVTLHQVNNGVQWVAQMAFSGVNVTTPLDCASAKGTTNTSTNTLGTLTTVTANAMRVAFAHFNNVLGGSPWFSVTPSGFTTRDSEAAFTNTSYYVGTILQAIAGASATASFTTNGTVGGQTNHLALRPDLATATGTANATPAAIALTATVPAPTVSVSVEATPATIALVVTVPNPAASGASGGEAAPATIALAVVTSAPTVTGGSDTAPAAVTLATTTPSATATGSATTSPAAIPLLVVTPAPSASGASSGEAAPATIALAVTTPVPTATGGSNATPAAVTISATVPTPTGTGDGSTAPATIALAATVPDPTAGSFLAGEANPTAVTLAATVPDPTATGVQLQPYWGFVIG